MRGLGDKNKVARPLSQPRQSCTSRPAPLFPAGGGSSFLLFPSPPRWSAGARTGGAPCPATHARLCGFATHAPGKRTLPPLAPHRLRARRPPPGGSCARTRSPSAKVARPLSQPRQSCTSRPAPLFPAGGGSSFLPFPRPRAEAQALGQVALHAPTTQARLCGFATRAPGGAVLLRRPPGACALGWRRAWPPHTAHLRATSVRGGPGRASLSPCREAVFSENRPPPADAVETVPLQESLIDSGCLS